MSARRGPVGQGYMPKGGVRAAREHNEAWKAERVEAAPQVDAGGGGGRARQRAAFAAGPSSVAVALGLIGATAWGVAIYELVELVSR